MFIILAFANLALSVANLAFVLDTNRFYGVTYLKKLVETPLDVRLNPCATGPSGILQGSI